MKGIVKSVPHVAPKPGEVLSSWKEIANYLRRDVRTVQRWEASRGLPVHRLPGAGRHAIYAVPSELDTWWASTPAQLELAHVSPPAPPPVVSRQRIVAALLIVVLLVAAVWLFSRTAGTPSPLPETPLTSLPGYVGAPTLSPDGSRLVFSWMPDGQQNLDLYLAGPDGGAPERLTMDPAMDLFPEWSPDGRSIAYLRGVFGSGTGEVRLIDLQSRSDRLLFTFPVGAIQSPPEWTLAWTADGRALVCPTPREGGTRYGLSRWDIAAGILTPITFPETNLTGDHTPAVSPDGRTLAFNRRTVSGEGFIYTIRLKPDGTPDGVPTRLSSDACCESCPSWTRDGREIIFVSRLNGVTRLMRAPAGGGAARVDTTAPAPGIGPRVAANGWLLFSREWPHAGTILSVGLAGRRVAGKPATLIASSREESMPDYSPDGAFIAVSSNRSGSPQIWVCNRRGGNPRQLTKMANAAAVAPSWSPDGLSIAFGAESRTGSAIYLVSAKGGQPWPLITQGRHNRFPRWSRKSPSILFSSDRSGRFEIWRVDLAPDGTPREPRQITKEGGFAAFESGDGEWLYYSKEFTLRSLWRVPSSGGKEEVVLEDFPFNRYPANLTASKEGLYFRGQQGDRTAQLWFMPFSGPFRPQLLAEDLPLPGLGIAISPDGRQILLTTHSRRVGDVIAVKGFR